MKTKLKFILFTFFLGLLLISSCTDSTEDPGDNIQKYTGEWNVNDESARINYKVIISANPSNSTEILMQNFADLGGSAVALVIGNNLALDTQPLGSDYTIIGSGSYINSNKLVINFDLNDGIDNEPRIATFTR